MFKFFKELVDAVREGAAEAKTELAEESRQQEAAAQRRQFESQARLAATPRYEQFLVALGAPYKQTYTRELQAAARDERAALFLFCLALPPDEKTETWRSMLDRDFSVTGRETLVTTVEAIIGEQLAPASGGEEGACRALWIGRACHLIAASAAVSYVPEKQAQALAEPFVRAAIERYTGWQDYARQFVEGERSAPGSNMLGHKIIEGSVELLLKNPLSPWSSLAWPQTPAEIDALIGTIGNRPQDE